MKLIKINESYAARTLNTNEPSETLITKQSLSALSEKNYNLIIYFYLHWINESSLSEDARKIASHPAANLLKNESTLLFLDYTHECFNKRANHIKILKKYLLEPIGASTNQTLICSQTITKEISEKEINHATHHLYVHAYSLKKNIKNLVETERENLKQETIKDFICMNSNIRPHRTALYSYLMANNLLENSHTSFRPSGIRRGKSSEKNLEITQKNFDNSRKIFPSFSKHITSLSSLSHSELAREIDKINSSSNAVTLSNSPPWKQIINSRLYISTESEFHQRNHPTRFTEKTLNPILAKVPFIIVGLPGTLETLQQLGFRKPFQDTTIAQKINWDNTINPDKRLREIALFINEWVAKKEISSEDKKIISETCSFNQIHILSERLRETLFNNFYHDLLNIPPAPADSKV